MQSDTRSRNKIFNMESIGNYLNEYSQVLVAALDKVDKKNLEQARQQLMWARAFSKRVFVGGNGGSASISEHLECDMQKGCHVKHKLPLLTRSLNSNLALLTAIANDIGYESIFSYQLELADAKDGEILILVSSSGNSPNIVKAARWAKENSMITIGLTGFDGGDLRDLADVSLHVPFENYGIVEDAHQALMHVLAQFQYMQIKHE